MSKPLVSIVTAAYKTRPDHLVAAIQSALGQTWSQIEMIVSDDSPDQSLKAVVTDAADPRVRYRHNSPSLGVARNHWSCFREVAGKYIAVLNHDDCLAPTFIERLIEPLERDSLLALAFCDHWVIDGEGRVLTDETDRVSALWGRSQLAPGTHRPFFDLLAAQTIPMAMGTVFNRRLLPPFLPGDAGPAYDLWLTYLLCREGLGACYVAERLSSWRVHETSLTTEGGADWAYGAAECWRAIVNDPRLASIASAAQRKAALAFVTCAKRSWKARAPITCMRFGLQALLMFAATTDK